jgi:hypothetical protein
VKDKFFKDKSDPEDGMEWKIQGTDARGNRRERSFHMRRVENNSESTIQIGVEQITFFDADGVKRSRDTTRREYICFDFPEKAVADFLKCIGAVPKPNSTLTILR